jgi:hypothetical protein
MADAATAAEKKDLLLSQGAHEIRNPVSVILGYVRMLMTDRLGPLTDMQRKVLGDVATSTVKLAALADEMSLLARLLAGGTPFARAHVELAALIAAEIPSVGPALERDVGLRVIDNAPGAPVNGDAQRLGEAVNSLMFAQRRELFTCDELCVAIDRVPGSDHRSIRMTIAGANRIEALRRLPTAEMTALVEFRSGLGYRLSIARLVIEAHRGRVFSIMEPGDIPKSVLNIGTAVILPEA